MQDLDASYQAQFRSEGSEQRSAEAGRNAFADTVNELYRPTTKYTTDSIPGLKEDCAKNFLPECSIFGSPSSDWVAKPPKCPDHLIKPLKKSDEFASKKDAFSSKKDELGWGSKPDDLGSKSDALASKKDEYGLIKKPEAGEKKNVLGSKKDEHPSLKKPEPGEFGKEKGLMLKGKPEHLHQIKPLEGKPGTSGTANHEAKPGAGAITNELPPPAWERVKPVKPEGSDHVKKEYSPYMGVFKTPEGDLTKKPLDNDQQKKVELNEMNKKIELLRKEK